MALLNVFRDFFSQIPQNIWIFMLVGFAAQVIDGTLGMAYGVSCNSFLLSLGIPPALASASVHTAEVFTTLVSGISHWKLKNVDKRIFLKLMIPGVLGGVAGAWLLSGFDGNTIKPFINIYLVAMGIVIIIKVFKTQKNRQINNMIYPLGLVGGFVDATGGGGWGPVVTGTLIATGVEPRYTIGTVNAAEFFVTVAQTVVFISLLGIDQTLYAITGLVIGGIIAAPLAAYLCKKVPIKSLMAVVGILIIFLNVKSLVEYIIALM